MSPWARDCQSARFNENLLHPVGLVIFFLFSKQKISMVFHQLNGCAYFYSSFKYLFVYLFYGLIIDEYCIFGELNRQLHLARLPKDTV